MIYAIPSKGRSGKVKTLDLFPEAIVFVEPQEFNEYQDAYPNVQSIRQNDKGIAFARNVILERYCKENIVMLDDDISGVQKLEKGKLVTMNRKEIDVFIESAFKSIKKIGTKLWGIYPVPNAFYMDNSASPCGFIIGTMFGVIPDLRFDENLNTKEDYDFTIQHIKKFGKVLRYNNITIKADHYNNSGGCVDQRKKNPEIEKEVVDKLKKKWPGIVRDNPKREGEILLNFRKKKC